MAIIRKCDRCKTVYEHYLGEIPNSHGCVANAIRYLCVGKYDLNYENQSTAIDLCPKCFNLFTKWMEEGQ